jgi:hypothetical protein
MRVIALEEHFTAPHLVGRIDAAVVRRRGYHPRRVAPGSVNPMELAAEIGERRLRLMDPLCQGSCPAARDDLSFSEGGTEG